MISIQATTRLLWVVAFILAAIAFLLRTSDENRDVIDGFLVSNAGILTSVGTLVLIGFLTVYATHLSNKSAELREKNNRYIASEIKTSEFRQEWIDALRDDLSQIVGLSDFITKADERTKVVQQLKILDARVRLRLNPTKEAESEIKELVWLLVDAVEVHSDKLPAIREKLADVGAIFIKDQWEDLKSRLADAKRGLNS